MVRLGRTRAEPPFGAPVSVCQTAVHTAPKRGDLCAPLPRSHDWHFGLCAWPRRQDLPGAHLRRLDRQRQCHGLMHQVQAPRRHKRRCPSGCHSIWDERPSGGLSRSRCASRTPRPPSAVSTGTVVRSSAWVRLLAAPGCAPRCPRSARSARLIEMVMQASPPCRTAARRAFSLTSPSLRVILSTGSARCRASTDRRMTGLDRRHRADVRSMAPEARTARPGTRGMRHRGRALWSRRMCGGLVTGGLPGQLPPLRRRPIAATGLPSAARRGAAPGCRLLRARLPRGVLFARG